MSNNDLLGIPKRSDPNSTRSTIHLAGGNLTSAQGTTGTSIRCYANPPVEYTGAAITYLPSLVYGDSFQINEDGLYFLYRNDFRGSTSALEMGFSKWSRGEIIVRNADITTIPAKNRLCYTATETNPSNIPSVSILVPLLAGDIILSHEGAVVSTSFSNLERCILRITKVNG